MAKKKAAPEPPEGILTTAAKTIGTAAGKIAAAVGMTPPEPEAKKPAGKKAAKKYKAPAVKKAKKAVKKTLAKSQNKPAKKNPTQR